MQSTLNLHIKNQKKTRQKKQKIWFARNQYANKQKRERNKKVMCFERINICLSIKFMDAAALDRKKQPLCEKSMQYTCLAHSCTSYIQSRVFEIWEQTFFTLRKSNIKLTNLADAPIKHCVYNKLKLKFNWSSNYVIQNNLTLLSAKFVYSNHLNRSWIFARAVSASAAEVEVVAIFCSGVCY